MKRFDATFDDELQRFQTRAIDISKHPYLAPWKQKIETPEFFPMVKRDVNIRFCVVPYSTFLPLEQPTPSINAFVFKHPVAKSPNDGIIAVHLETCLQSHLLANHLFASKAFWPEIGDVSCELHEVAVMPPFNPYDNESHRQACAVVPRCPTRVQASGFFFSLMLAVLFQHEKYHVLRGHLGHALANAGTGINESGTDIEGTYGTHRAVRIAQEFDADTSAIANIVRATGMKAEVAQAFPALDLHAIHARMAVLAACAVLTLVDRADPSTRHQSMSGCYPAVVVRQFAILSTAVMTIQRGPEPDAAERILANINRDGRVLYRAVPYAVGVRATDVVLPVISKGQLMQDTAEVQQIWQRFAPEHQRHACVDVLGR